MTGNLKLFLSSIAAALLSVNAAQASNLITDGTFLSVNTALNAGGTLSTYWQPGTSSGTPSATNPGNGLLSYWSTPTTTYNTSFVFLSGTGNGTVCQSNVVAYTSCQGNNDSTFTIYNSQNKINNPRTNYPYGNDKNAGGPAPTGNLGNVVNPPGGGNFIVADGDNTLAKPLSQSITGLTAGNLYQVTFYQASGQQSGFGCQQTGGFNDTNCTNDQWAVNLGGTFSNGSFTGGQTDYSTLMTNPLGGFTSWTQQSLVFTANAATETLSFLASGSPNGYPPVVLLNDVAMVRYAPEPSTLAIMGLGLLGLGILRARLSKRS